MSTKRSNPLSASRRRGLVVAGALCAALASTGAFGQTAFGASSTIVFPVVASTSTFVGTVTLYNPNLSDLTVHLDYFDANNLATAGAKVCNDVVIPANLSVQFTLGDQCALEPGSHFGVLVVADSAGANPIVGYSRTENNAGAGFSIEAFPLDNFATGQSNAVGLKQSAAPPTYQTNCFVTSLGSAVTYDLKLIDGTTGAQIGNTVSGSLNAFEQFRYLDVFAAASAPPGDYSNVRAQFIRTSAVPQPLIGFCTVQDSVSFGADFRIGKTQAPPPPAVQTLSSATWQGAMITLNSNQPTYVFMGPTATATLNVAGTVTANGGGEFRTNGGSSNITVAVCYQDAVALGPITPMGTPSSLTATSTLAVRFATGSASLPAGTYNVGLCATNPSIGPVQKNGNTVGVVTVTQ
jgi:hypothetical protein